MAWRHRIAFAMLLALAGAPFGETVCAMMCDSPSTRPAAHGSDGRCEEPAPSPSAARIGGASQHDCSTQDAAIHQVATAASDRADQRGKIALAVGRGADLIAV